MNIDYRMLPCLELRHGNTMETGLALRLHLVPAAQDREGHIRVSLAAQIGQTRFDWDNACYADLGAVALAKLLMVFQGWIEANVSDGSGDNNIRISRENTITCVDLRDEVDPGPTYVLTMTRYVLHESKTEIQIALSNAEALALTEAIRGAMHRVAFGDTHLVMGLDFGREEK